MSNEVMEKETLAMPKLVLEMEEESVADIVPADVDEIREQRLTDEENAQVEAFASKIDFNDSTIIVTYGSSAQKRLAEFSESALESVRNKDMGEIGEMLSSLVADLKVDPTEKKGLSKIFAKVGNKAEELRAHYSKLDTNIAAIVKKLEAHEETLLRDIVVQDKLYENNKLFFKEITMYILAGKKALEEARAVTIPEMKAAAERTGLAEDAQNVRNYIDVTERFEKKLYDLDLTRTICLQNAPQIKIVQNNAIIMVDKIQSAINNTIPLWKNQMVISLGLIHSKEAVRAQQMVTDTTNELLSKNAELLHQTSKDIAVANERGIVDLETLKHTNEELIATIDDIRNIQEEGRRKRQEAEQEIIKLENELKQKLMS